MSSRSRRTLAQRATATIAGVSAVTASMSGLGIGLAPGATAAPAPGQDVNNDWGQTAEEIAAEIEAAAVVDARVIAATARCTTALDQYNSIKKVEAVAVQSLHTARLSPSKTDDVRATTALAAVRARVAITAQELKSARSNLVAVNASVRSEIRNNHYIHSPYIAPPETPTNLVGEAGNAQVTISWDAVDGATDYRVIRNGRYLGVTTTESLVDAGLENGVSYTYQVFARNTAGWSLWSSPVTVTPDYPTPSVPTSLVAAAGNGQISLAWVASADAVSYQVFRGGVLIASPTDTTYVDAGIPNGEAQTYTVVAVGVTHPSSASSPVVATPVAPAPSAPTGVLATPGDRQIVLTWAAPAGATSYRVYRNGFSVATTVVPTFTDTGLTNATSYTYTVVAYTVNSPASGASSAIIAAPVATAPAAPSNLIVVVGDARLSLSWTATSGASAYQVFRDGTQIGTLTPSRRGTLATSYTDSTAVNGVEHTYYITATTSNSLPSSASNSAVATAVATAPSAPTALAATVGDGRVVLAWTAPTAATSYNIFRNGTLLGTSTTASFTDATASNGTAYTYAVTAVTQNSVASANSNSVTATPKATAPAAPTSLTTSVGDTAVALTWAAPTNADSYNVYRDGTLVATVAATSYLFTGLTNGTSYTFYVTATKQNSNASVASASVTGTPVSSPPAAPTGLNATSGNSQVGLTWSFVTGATSYRIYRGGVQIGSTAGLNYVDSTAVNGTPYTYYLVAVAPSAVSAASISVTATAAATVVGEPAGVSGQAGDTTATVSWSGVSGASWYKVYRNGVLVSTLGGNSYTDVALVNGTTYAYYVTSVAGGVVSAASATVAVRPSSVMPAIPTAVAASSGDAQITLTWPAAANAASYQVFRDGVLVGSPTTPTFTDAGLVNGTTYSYTVTSVNGSATSSASVAVSTSPLAGATAGPTGLASNAGDGQVTLTWLASADATSYQVFRGGSVVGSPTATTFTDTGLTNGTAYSYYVVAVKGATNSGPSTSISATPIASAPGSPTGLAATAGNGQVALTWTAPAGATSYSVYRGGIMVASTASASYTDTGLTNGTAYTYYVVAFKQNSIASTASSTVSATPQVSGASAPIGVSATAGIAQVIVAWAPVTGATSYQVFRGGVLVGSPTTTTYTDTGLTAGTAYSYTVTAVNGAGSSAPSAAVAATPTTAAPTGLAATVASAQVALTWTSVTGATSYKVYRGGVLVASPTAAAYTDTAVTNGTAYSYYVTAIAGTTASAASSTVTATPAGVMVSGTFVGTAAAIVDTKEKTTHGYITVTVTLVNSKITVSKGVLTQSDGADTNTFNRTALPSFDTQAVTANSANITNKSGASFSLLAYKSSLQSALTTAGL